MRPRTRLGHARRSGCPTTRGTIWYFLEGLPTDVPWVLPREVPLRGERRSSISVYFIG